MTTHELSAGSAPRGATISIGALGIEREPVLSLEGEEELGRAPRFVITFAGGDDIDAAVGAAARVVAGERVIGGVIADVESGEGLCRVTLAPRAWLLSRGRASRAFERLAAPEIIEAVAAASGVEVHVERHLRDAHPVRACTVQHRESDLDFILRLAERDGLGLAITDDGERCTLRLSDHNEALPDAGELVHVSEVRRKSTLLPRRVELVSADPARPELPLRAMEAVLETGAGDLQIHDVPFATPEEGARAARLYAEWLRSTAILIHGRAHAPISCGIRARVAGREIAIVAVRHALSREGVWTSHFTAVPAQTPFRPERRAPAPRAFGLMGGRLAPRDPGLGGQNADKQVRVRESAGDAERLMSMAGGGAFERDLAEGTQVVWGCLDGDPERPVITAVIPDSAAPARAVLRGPGGAVFEVGGAAAPGLGEAEGWLDRGVVPAVAHHADVTDQSSTYGSGTGTTDTWMRYAVPHTDGAWSYVRIGEAATSTPLSATDSSGGAVTFTESSDKCMRLKLNSYDASGLAGVFDFTDKNRTVLTKGNWEHLVKGQARLVVYGGGGANKYALRVGESVTHLNIKTPCYSYTDGISLSAFGGMKAEALIGGQIELMLGGKASADVGFQYEATVGYKYEYVHADSFEVRKGEELSSSSTLDKRASNKIQFSISDGSDDVPKETKMAALIAGLGALGLAAGTETANELFSDSDAYTGAVTGLYAAAAIAGIIRMRTKSVENDLIDGNPIMSLDKDEGIAALRADDWLLLMSPNFAVLGKNKPYDAVAGVISVSDLDKDDAGTAIVIEEGNKIRLQAGTTADQMATIALEAKNMTIVADSVVIQGTTADSAVSIKGAVTIDGDVTLKKKLTVTGASTFKDTIAGPTGTIQVKP